MKNKIKLNAFHQIKRKKKGNNPKKKLRDLQRLIKNPKLDETLKAEKVKEIEKLKENLDKSDKINEKKDRKLYFLSKKYDKIRNIEKVKLKRKLKRKITEISALQKSDENLKELEHQKNEIIEQINYIKFYPKDKKYISIFKDLDPKAREMQNNIKEDIKNSMKTRHFKKYDSIKEKPKIQKKAEKIDDFFFNDDEKQEMPLIVTKKIVDKRGRIIEVSENNQ